MASHQGKKRASLKNSSEEKQGILSRVTESSVFQNTKRAASEAGTVTKKLLRSTGKAAWITGTNFLVVIMPLMFVMECEQQLNELDFQQASILGAPPPHVSYYK